MGSRRNRKARTLASSSEEDDAGRGTATRNSTITFRIHVDSGERLTSSKKRYGTRFLKDHIKHKTEKEIKDILGTELPQLKGKQIKFYSQDTERNRYFCPCELWCKHDPPMKEWNGKNISKLGRVVHILIIEEGTATEETDEREPLVNATKAGQTVKDVAVKQNDKNAKKRKSDCSGTESVPVVSKRHCTRHSLGNAMVQESKCFVCAGRDSVKDLQNNETDAIDAHVSILGKRRISVLGDGHCIVRAFSLGLKEAEDHIDHGVESLLAKTREEFLRDIELYSQFVGDIDLVSELDSYINSKNYDSCVVDLVLYVLANVTQSSVNVFWVRGGQVCEVLIPPSKETSRRTIYVCKIGNHYDAILNMNPACSLKIKDNPLNEEEKTNAVATIPFQDQTQSNSAESNGKWTGRADESSASDNRQESDSACNTLQRESSTNFPSEDLVHDNIEDLQPYPLTLSNTPPSLEELMEEVDLGSWTDEEMTGLFDIISLNDQTIRRKAELKEDKDEADDYKAKQVGDTAGEEQEEKEEQQQQMEQQMQLDDKNPTESTLTQGISTGRTASDNSSGSSATDSGYNTVHTEGSAHALSGVPYLSPQHEVLQPSLNSDRAPVIQTQRIERNQQRAINLLTIDEITPEFGDVRGGYKFTLTLLGPCEVDDVQVQFGNTVPVPVRSRNGSDFTDLIGIVPAAADLTPGEVPVLAVSPSGHAISDAITFIYTGKGIRDIPAEDVKEALMECLRTLEKKQKQVEASQPGKAGDAGTNSLSVLRTIVETAATINAIFFFRILFSTHLGRSVFKCFRGEETLLEEVARRCGNEELACLLEQKHLMYQDDENESDDEVDLKELAKALEKYQSLNGKVAEKKSISSTSSSERIHGYLGDSESSTSVSSLHVSVAEVYPENTDEKQNPTPESRCQEDPSNCQTSELAEVAECSLPSPTAPYVGGNLEIEEIVADALCSSDKVQMDKAHKLEDSHSAKGEKNSFVTLYSNPLYLPRRHHEMFAPKEVEGLRRQLKSFDNGISMPFYPDTERTIYNVFQSLDAPPVLDFLKETADDLEVQVEIEHPQTNEKEPNGQEGNGFRALKSEVLPNFWNRSCSLQDVFFSSNKSAILPGVEQGVEPSINAENYPQNGQKSISQTSVRSVSRISVNEPPGESHPDQHSRLFGEEVQNKWKPVCLSSVKTKVFALAFVGILLLIIIGVPVIFQASAKVSSSSTTTTTTTTTAPETTTKIQACFNEPLTLHCETLTNVTAVFELKWKIKLPGTGWSDFSYCNESLNCIVMRPFLPGGIKVLDNSNGIVTLERMAKNNTNARAQTLCEAHYTDNSVTSQIHDISFTAKCVWIQKGHDLNLTRILLNMLSWEHVVDVDWYDIHGSKFAWCNSCWNCTKTNTADGNQLVLVFWNRLQVSRGYLLLTGIHENDDGLTIRVKVHKETSGKPAKRDFGANIESPHVYTIRIFVSIARCPPEKEKKTLSMVWERACRVEADFHCKPEQIYLNTTMGKSPKCLNCPDCPAGSQPSVPCGSSVKHWPGIHCVPCTLGKTYSDKNDKAQCKVCSVCFSGKATMKNCTLSSNSQCFSKCKQGYYYEPFIPACFPCWQCCNDGKDELAIECRRYKKKCKVRASLCANVVFTNVPATTTLIGKIQPMSTQVAMTVKQKPTWPGNGRAVSTAETRKWAFLALTLVFFVLLLVMVGICCRKLRNVNSNNKVPESVETQLNWDTSASQVRLNPGPKILLRDVSNTIIEDLSRYLNVGNRWKQLGSHLDFSSSQINNFELDPSNATQNMLQEWAQRDGATVEVLQAIFHRMNWTEEEKIVGAYVP